VSWRGLCIDCADRRMIANSRQISAEQGPYYERRRLGYARKYNLIPAELVQIIE
jgi:hypothetical protein